MPVESFHEVRFPTDWSYGSTGGPEFSTRVIKMLSGGERRNQRWLYAQTRFDLAYGVKAQDDLDFLITFFMVRRAKAIGFRLRDPRNYIATDEVCPEIETTSDGDDYQLVKNHTDDGGTYDEKVTKPVGDDGDGYPIGQATDTVVVKVGGVTQTKGVDYTLDYATGILTFLAGSIPSGSSGESAVTWSGQFDLAVRFDTDLLSRRYADYQAGSATVPIVGIPL
jgi:uncharacterized protein (TIGR02217 family)